MSKIILTKGLPASGKTTWALQQLEAHSGQLKRVNKDELRAMLDGGKWSQKNEKQILAARDSLIQMAIQGGRDVIVDDTNLAPQHENHLRQLAQKLNAEVEIQDFTDVSLEVCLARNAKRAARVPDKVIKEMYYTYIFKPPPAPEYVPSMHNIVMCDLDGTLAIMSKRSPFEWHRVGEDDLNSAVAYMLRSLADGAAIFLMSGRDSVCRQETEAWLFKHGIPYASLFMRPAGNSEPDTVIKERMYKENIEGKYNVVAVFDDRPSVCRLWRRLGLPVFQVGNPDLEF